MLVDSIVSLLPMAQAGKVRPIATTAFKRTALAPEIPTAAESGFPAMTYSSWYGIWAHKDTPTSIVDALNSAINTATEGLSRSGALSSINLEPVIETATAFKKFIDEDVKQSSMLLEASGFSPE